LKVKLKSKPASPVRRGIICDAIALSAGVCLASGKTFAQPSAKVPEPLASIAPFDQWKLRGTGVLKVFLFKVYDAQLWSHANINALEMTYSLAVKSDDLISSSLAEMTRLRTPTAAQSAQWSSTLKSAFPSVVAGDKLLGIQLTNNETRFFHNGKLTAEVKDASFTDAFFAIWLDEKTKEPGLRKGLLGLN
jgi:Chalcone isomerase-like